MLASVYCTSSFIFFFNDTATTEIYTLSLHDALPIYFIITVNQEDAEFALTRGFAANPASLVSAPGVGIDVQRIGCKRSEEHTSELQSRQYLVCRLLLEKKKKTNILYVMTKINFSLND